MGIDVSAYKNLVEVARPEDPDHDDNYDYRMYENLSFPGRADGIDTSKLWTGDYVDGPSMSYGYYNKWREQLAQLVGAENLPYSHEMGFQRMSYCTAYWLDGKQGPFAEQINFSDCEGVIGPIVMAKLAKDYAEWDERAKTHGDQWFYSVYQKFHHCFAQNEGLCAVKFH